MEILHIFKIPGLLNEQMQKLLRSNVPSLVTCNDEMCFNVEILSSKLTQMDREKVMWLLSETFESQNTRENVSFLELDSGSVHHEVIIEVGPRLAYSTAWSSNCVSMCRSCGIESVTRVERSRRFKLNFSEPYTQNDLDVFAALVHDRMTECVYNAPLTSFDSGVTPEGVFSIPLLSGGQAALEEFNRTNGLGFDEQDLQYYTNLFTNILRRDLTNVECFDLSQSNSEHSRHWFFGGRMVIDGAEQKETLFQMVKSTLPHNSNSVIAFHDNSSAIRGYEVDVLSPADVSSASPLCPNKILLHPILTAETHNFPTGVAPFAGAETGTGGRLRDVQATGRGAFTLAGVSAYCVGGNLCIPNHSLPWEDAAVPYASNLAKPLDILVEASNGASDYGNKYGEPVVAGFTRSFGQRIPLQSSANGDNPAGSRVEWVKPVMFTAGVGMLDDRHAIKGQPETGMVVCKIGGPAYRIGMGGGSASSRLPNVTESTEGGAEEKRTSDQDLDFNAVQRGDAEMENRMNRVVRACVEMGQHNPIVSIHDQGAGGNGNVLKEIVDPLGATYQVRSIPLGDPTLSVCEIWGAEYQENNAILLNPADLGTVQKIGERENCPVTAVGAVTGDGRVVLTDSNDDSVPFDLPLSYVLGKMPQKTYEFSTPKKNLQPLSFPADITVSSALDRVLRLVDVGSKRFLTNKVDRSVTGLVAQQQCVGPLHTPLSDVAVLAQSHFSLFGVAVAVGEQPIKGLVDCGAQARMTVAEALGNLVCSRISSLEDVKASCNWMWAAKMDGEGAKMYAACSALRDMLLALGVGIDGGKDSLSMAAVVEGEVVKAPGEMVLTCYAPTPDITKTVTPDFKHPGEGRIVFVDLGVGANRLGGSALSTVYRQVGDVVPDVQDVLQFGRAFKTIQQLLDDRLLASCHDRSDGGVLVTLLEMCFAGNVGMEIFLPVSVAAASAAAVSTITDSTESPSVVTLAALGACFAEEVGFVLEVLPAHLSQVMETFAVNNVPAEVIGHVTADKQARVSFGGEMMLDASMPVLRDVWESTSAAIEQLQCNPECAAQERDGLATRTGSQYSVTFDVLPTPEIILRAPAENKCRVAVVRQEGSNGDRELCAAFHTAGFQVWDVNMHDLISGDITLDRFKGVSFCGGFSYADVNGSAKGWAACIRFNELLLGQFRAFRDREDTFSLGVCNGAQLMAVLGWIPFPESSSEKSVEAGGGSGGADKTATDKVATSETTTSEKQMRFVHNTSGRFESRWCAVKVQSSPAVLLRGMEGSTLGIWIAHGEGKAFFPEPAHLASVLEQRLAPLRYVDDSDRVTESYPENPSGSPQGIAAVCSTDGRHLAMMPHPERCFLKWQLPYAPENLKTVLQGHSVAPWLKLFQNAREFCEEKQ